MELGSHAELRQFDLVTLGGILKVCDTELVLLNACKPMAAFDSIAHDGAFFCSGQYGFSFRASFSLPPDWCLLGYFHDVSSQSWCHGVGLESGVAQAVLPGGYCDFMLSAGARWSFMVAPVARLQKKMSQLVPGDFDARASHLKMFVSGTNPASVRLGQHYELIRRCLAEANGLDTGTVDSLIEDHLRAALEAGAEDRPVRSRGRQMHYKTLRRAEDFMRTHLRRDIYVQELCDFTGASERTLRYAFDDLIGIPPNRYLSMLRLCAAYRSLAYADASVTSVKSVALSCGMWDLSRFAEYYRGMFGELPRATLTRLHEAPVEAAFDEMLRF